MNYKLLFSVAVIFAFLLTVGTAAAAIQINSEAELMAIDIAGLDEDYILMKDLDFATTTFTPIGDYSHPFTGTFNGNNKTISNITFSNSNTISVGLFSSTDNAFIFNLTLKNVSFEGNSYVGGLIGRATDTSVSRCSVVNSNSCQISGQNSVGVFIGVIEDSTILNSSATGDANGTNTVGGFIGYIRNSVVSNSSATSDADGDTNVGSFVGYMVGSTISNSSAAGNATGTGDTVGGFVGNMTGSDISKSYATGSATGANYVGGFVGGMYTNASVSESYALGNADGTGSYIGGFVGLISDLSSIVNCYAMGDADGSSAVGGFVGGVSLTPSISNSYATGDATGSGASDIGGFVGNGSTLAVVDSLYSGMPAAGNGSSVLSTELMQICSFLTGTYVSADWSISPSPNPQFIWYIDEDNDSPKFYWSYPVPSRNGSGGSGTGSATIVDNTPQNNTPQNNTTQNNTTQNNTPVRDDTPVPEPTDPESKSFPWWILIIILILIVLGAAYYLYSKRNQN